MAQKYLHLHLFRIILDGITKKLQSRQGHDKYTDLWACRIVIYGSGSEVQEIIEGFKNDAFASLLNRFFNSSVALLSLFTVLTLL